MTRCLFRLNFQRGQYPQRFCLYSYVLYKPDFVNVSVIVRNVMETTRLAIQLVAAENEFPIDLAQRG